MYVLAYSDLHSYKPQPKATWMQRMSSTKTLDEDTMNTVQKAGKVVGILVLVVLVVVAGAGAGALVFWYVVYSIKSQSLEVIYSHIVV